jgi:hypothetical protein
MQLEVHDGLGGIGEVASIARRRRHDGAVEPAGDAFHAFVGEPDAIDLAAAVTLAGEEEALVVGGPHRILLRRTMIGQADEVATIGVHDEDVEVP